MVVADKELEAVSSTKRKEVIQRLFGKKKKLPEIEVIPEMPPEIERAQPVPGAAAQLTKPVIDDQTGQVLVTSAAAQTPVITLPLTEKEMRQGITYKLIYSVRWLTEWCWRLAKKMGLKLNLRKKKQ